MAQNGIVIPWCPLVFWLAFLSVYFLPLFAFGDFPCWLVFKLWIDLMTQEEKRYMFHKQINIQKNLYIVLWNSQKSAKNSHHKFEKKIGEMVQFDTTIHQVFASKAKYFRLEGTWSDEYISKKFEDFFCSFEV